MSYFFSKFRALAGFYCDPLLHLGDEILRALLVEPPKAKSDWDIYMEAYKKLQLPQYQNGPVMQDLLSTYENPDDLQRLPLLPYWYFDEQGAYSSAHCYGAVDLKAYPFQGPTYDLPKGMTMNNWIAARAQWGLDKPVTHPPAPKITWSGCDVNDPEILAEYKAQGTPKDMDLLSRTWGPRFYANSWQIGLEDKETFEDPYHCDGFIGTELDDSDEEDEYSDYKRRKAMEKATGIIEQEPEWIQDGEESDGSDTNTNDSGIELCEPKNKRKTEKPTDWAKGFASSETPEEKEARLAKDRAAVQAMNDAFAAAFDDEDDF
ncbi:Protein of unknown function [Pyronema omphalodes CBS 100304]|uniref:Uncharacterized protein n=1 Tax=Pyronema omphalodes (strain CBS 100304) TaxID=1076935 RepID=U4L0B9_PYROM|nr:Protein of unknown function [Pyronema omphalodes CBS 100304]